MVCSRVAGFIGPILRSVDWQCTSREYPLDEGCGVFQQDTAKRLQGHSADRRVVCPADPPEDILFSLKLQHDESTVKLR